MVLALLLTWVGPLVAVEGTSTCPSPGEVAARLEALLPRAPASHQPDIATVESADGPEPGLIVRLHTSSDRLVAARVLTGAHSCSDLARAAAVFIAAVAIDAHPEISGLRGPPLLERPADPVVLDRPATKAPVAANEVTQASSTRRWELEIGLGGGATWSGSLAGAGTVLLTFGQTTRPVGAWLSFSGEGHRDTALSGGVARWTTFTSGLGARWRHRLGWLTLDWHGEGLAAVLTVSGRGFPQTYADRGFGAGLGGGLRLSAGLGRTLRLWIDAGGKQWLTTQAVYAGDRGNSARIPPRSMSLLTGLSFLAGP